MRKPDTIRYVFTALLSSVLLLAWPASAYDPSADPATDYAQALSSAAESDRKVLVVFGADWCPDCRAFDQLITQAPLQATIEEHFVVMHVDIGNWDRNMAFTEQFGEPVAKGIPSIAILSADKDLLYVAEGGEFASARSSTTEDLNDWFMERLTLIGQ